MIIVFKPHTPAAEIEKVEQLVVANGYEPRKIQGTEQSVIACVGDETSHKSLEALVNLPCVERILPVQKRYKMASREFSQANSVVSIGGVPLGGGNFQVIAGPCGIESEAQTMAVAECLVANNIKILRGGAFKPRTSPYDFQGMGKEGLDILAKVKSRYGLSIVTEIVGADHVDMVAEVADMMQIGARNCQNYHLLEKVAKAGKPVLLKRGLATSVDEWLLAAEYLIVNGCSDVVLCERGIRTFEPSTRFTLDVGAVATAKRETHLPVIVDPSHAAGNRSIVAPLAKAGIGAGADGIIVETHPNPAEALSDAAQQIPTDEFKAFLDDIMPLAQLCSRKP